jgi:hypothetical protein
MKGEPFRPLLQQSRILHGTHIGKGVSYFSELIQCFIENQCPYSILRHIRLYLLDRIIEIANPPTVPQPKDLCHTESVNGKDGSFNLGL